MLTSLVDPVQLTKLLRRQDGLITLAQARSVGLSASALTRRVQAPASGWRRVLPQVYLHGEADLTLRQQARAAVLYAGPGASITGGAALHWQRLRHLPREIGGLPVDVLLPSGRQVRSRDWVRVHRSGRPSSPYLVDGLLTMPVTRAVVDASLRLPYEAALALACACVNQGRTTRAQLLDELAESSRKG